MFKQEKKKRKERKFSHKKAFSQKWWGINNDKMGSVKLVKYSVLFVHLTNPSKYQKKIIIIKG